MTLATPPVPAAANVKGSALLPILEYYATQHGRERLLYLIGDLPPEFARAFDVDDKHFGVLVSLWYPAPLVHALLERMTAGATRAESSAFIRAVAQAVVKSTLNGVYRFLFQVMMSPERYLRNVQKLFSRFFDDGLVVKEPLGPRGHRSIISQWHGHHPLLCECFVYTSTYIYTAIGCRDVESRRTACISEGAPACTFEHTWS